MPSSPTAAPGAAQPISLGALIDALAECKQDADVYFDFCYLAPDGVRSYRGYYDHLAIGYREEGNVRVSELLGELRAAEGKIFTGYKGGDYRMSRETPMWAANYGRSGSTAIVGVYRTDYGTAYILTAHCEEWEGGTFRRMQVLFGGLGYGNV